MYNVVVITKYIVMNKLRTVMDPELHINIVDLGLIYDVVIKGNEIRVIMTLTTPGCPLAPVIDKLIKKALSELKADSVTIELVWERAWRVRRMSDEGKLQLGMI